MMNPNYFELYAKADLVSSLIAHIISDLENIKTDARFKSTGLTGDVDHICLQLWAVREVSDIIQKRLEDLEAEQDERDAA